MDTHVLKKKKKSVKVSSYQLLTNVIKGMSGGTIFNLWLNTCSSIMTKYLLNEALKT